MIADATGKAVDSEAQSKCRETTDLPTISVVTTCFNPGEYLDLAVQSVIAQEYPHLEHIVQDGASSDGTAELLTHYAKLPHMRVFSEKDRGQSDGLNRGFRRATGEIIGWLNADDLYPEGALLAVGRYFAEHPDAMVIHGNCELIDGRGQVTRFLQGEEITLEKLLAFQYVVGGTAYFFRRKVFEEIGYLDDSLHYAMDFDLWARMLANYEAHYLPVVLNQFRIHEESKTGKGFVDTFLPEIRQLMRRYRRAGAGPFQQLRRWAAEGRYASRWYWESVWEAHRQGDPQRARFYAREAGTAWPLSLNRYYRWVEFLRGCLARGEGRG